jgi:hypothetical protein
MKTNRTIIFVFCLALLLLLTSACQPAQPQPTVPTDAVPVPAALQPTATKAQPAATPPPTETPASTETPAPTEIPTLNPSARGYVSMVYDSESDKIILFGGCSEPIEGNELTPNGETWAYDVASNIWTNMKPASGPPENMIVSICTGNSLPKGGIDLVYDIESDRVIRFGGHWNTNDTWAYDYNTNTWTEMADGPKYRMGYRMAYDAESDRCILFGGLYWPPGVFNETYAYDFNSDTWTKMEPSVSPKGRNFHAMAYDPQADRVILFGGGNWDYDMDDTWAYDYNTDTWEEINPSDGTHPGIREGHAMVYNSAADQMLLYGGMLLWGGDAGGSETWSFDTSTSTWTLLEPDQTPGRRSLHAMAYDALADRVILFGGQSTELFDFTNQTWVYDPKANTWTDVTRSP